MPLTFYYGSGSPYAWRVWLALDGDTLRCGMRGIGNGTSPDQMGVVAHAAPIDGA